MRKSYDPWWLVKYVLISAADGVAAGWTLVLLLLWFDIGGLGALVHRSSSSDGVIALVILLLSFGVTFSLAGIGWRVMVLLPEDD